MISSEPKRWVQTLFKVLACLCLVLLTSPFAQAWERTSTGPVKAAHLLFTEVQASNGSDAQGRCTLALTVRYKGGERGLARVALKVVFTSGASVWTPVMETQASGSLSHRIDTQDADCWAAKPQRPERLVVSACFESDCKPLPFP